MAQQVKILAANAKPDDLSLLSSAHIVEEVNQLLQVLPSIPQMCCSVSPSHKVNIDFKKTDMGTVLSVL